MAIRRDQKLASGPNRTGRKHEMPELTNPIACVEVPLMLPLLPYMRLFFSRMYQANMWRTPEDAARARNYFSQQEAMMLACQNQAIVEQTTNDNSNLCTIISIVITLLSDGAIPPALAAGICSVVKDGIVAASGTIEHDAMLAQLLDIDEHSMGKDSNQLEAYQKTIAELIGGAGVVPPVD